MSVYVDTLFEARGPRGWGQWCHMLADSLDELHAMADRIGMKREWFQDKPGWPHYDLVPERRALAVEYGAVELSRKELVRKFRNAGQ